MRKTVVVLLFCCLISLEGLFAQERVNETPSPDSTLVAFTRSNDLWVAEKASGKEWRITSDGNDLILNGYASWVYYEEILGRPSRYKAFWWSPDSRRLGFYRFDNTAVPYFPIYSPFSTGDTSAQGHAGYAGKLNNTRYPKAGQANPLVRIGLVDVSSIASGGDSTSATVWADFPQMGGTSATATPGCSPSSAGERDSVFDGYFGVPFWSADSRDFYVPTLPRIQNDLNLFAVSAASGEKRLIYNEKYSTWLDWFTSMEFGRSGLYVARRFETGWDQLYFISYDGSLVERLTDSRLWDATVLGADEKAGKLYFSAKLDGAPRVTVFCVDIPREILKLSASKTSAKASSRNAGKTSTGSAVKSSSLNGTPEVQVEKKVSSKCNTLTSLTPPDMYAYGIILEKDFSSFAAFVSNSSTPLKMVDYSLKKGKVVSTKTLEDFTPEGYNPSECALPELISMTTSDGFTLPALITYPLGFDPSGAVKYPVVMEIYGGPDTPYVRDYWRKPNEVNQWFARNGIIKIVCDSRAAGHNGRAGEDYSYRDVTSYPVSDFFEWAEYLRSLPYVDSKHIGVEGFSFGGTMTTMLLFRHSDLFCCGIAGGGVYDWALYDTHYTERFMETPETNPEGYARACALNYVGEYPGTFVQNRSEISSQSDITPETAQQTAPKATTSMLRLTHGTGDDNVHFQNTLVLVDALQRQGKHFELMIYPDGMHGYRGYQGEHSTAADHDFWLTHLFVE